MIRCAYNGRPVDNLPPTKMTSRLTSFPILLTIAAYERQAKRTGALTFYETVSAAAEKVFDTLPRGLKRLCKLSFIQFMC